MSDNIIKSNMLSVGTMLRGIYRIDSYLSSGGFGNTYVATNIEFEERVAIKEFFMRGISERDDNNTTVSVSNAENEATFAQQREKFKKEARRLRKLKNDHIVRVHDLFEENGTAYYVMDLIDGESLSERLKRTGTPLTEAEVLKVLDQVLDALATVHKEGVWHLDLKPANIMVDRQGVVKLIDFGASKQQSALGGATTSSAISYTNGYAPREQMEQNLDKFGPWTDFYALGATMYTLLTNRRPPLPSDIDDDETEDKRQRLPMPQNVSEKTKKLVIWLMATNWRKRPRSVEAIRRFLANDAGEETVINADKEAYTVQADDETLVADNNEKHDFHDDNGTTNVVHETSNEPIKKDRSSNYRIVLVSALAVIVFIVLYMTGGRTSQVTYNNQQAVAQDSDTIAAGYVKQFKCRVVRGECTYTGYINEDGVPNGDGEAWFTNGRYYKGYFANGMMVDNDAFYRFENGDTFRGSFVNDHFSNGRYTIKRDQIYFVGSFDSKGQPKKGTWYDKNGKKMQNV